jgi:hypothetical protein
MDFTIWSNLLKQLLERQSLSRTQAAELMQGWINETIPPELSGNIPEKKLLDISENIPEYSYPMLS